MRLFLWPAVISLLAANIATAQSKFTNTERANQVRNDFKDADVVASNSESVYEFSVSDDNLLIKQSDRIDLISLKSNVHYARPVFYNDHLSITDCSIKYTSGRGSLKSDKVCGNYEVDDIFYSDAKLCSYFFDMLYEASEVTFKDEKEYHDPKYLTKVFFHDQDPTEFRKITFIIPNEADVELKEMNFDGFDIHKDVESKDGNKIYTYSIEKIKAVKPESHSLGYLYQYPHIIVVTKSYLTPNGRKSVLSSVDDLYAWYTSLISQVHNNQDALKPVVDQITAQSTNDIDKIKSIYYWVQENIKYIAFEDGIAAFIPESAQNVYKNRFGDCKGMANLTKAMLKTAGFDARLTWIGTNAIPYNYDLPSLAVDNHMICVVFNQGKEYILDPTEKYIALGNCGERIQGKEMLIEDGTHYIRKEVPIEAPSKNLITRTENIQIKDMALVGDGELSIKGEAKKQILYHSTNSRVDEKKQLYDFLSVSAFNNDDVVEVKNMPEVNREVPLDIQYNYSLKNKINAFDNDLYIEIDWDKPYSNLKFEDDRVSDYYFGRKVMNKIVKKMTIPKNYRVDHLPKVMHEKYKDITINVDFKIENHQIVYTNEIVVSSGIISKSDFDTWNGMISKLREIYNDQIVLKKI